MSEHVEIKVRDLKEGQRFWLYAGDIGKAIIERMVRGGAKVWANGPSQQFASCGSPGQNATVYAKSIINTGDTMSLQDELQKLKLKQDHAKATISGMEQGCLKREFDINALEIKIAEEAKPVLRHGDYVQWLKGNKSYYIALLVDGVLKWYSPAMKMFHGISELPEDRNLYAVICNVIDDLAAMQENVTEFSFKEYDSSDPLKVELKDGGEIRMSIKGNTLCVYEEEIPAFILGLRQLHATHLRKEASK